MASAASGSLTAHRLRLAPLRYQIEHAQLLRSHLEITRPPMPHGYQIDT